MFISNQGTSSHDLAPKATLATWSYMFLLGSGRAHVSDNRRVLTYSPFPMPLSMKSMFTRDKWENREDDRLEKRKDCVWVGDVRDVMATPANEPY